MIRFVPADAKPLVLQEGQLPKPAPEAKPTGASFSSILTDAVGDAARAHEIATQKREGLAAGTLDDVHGTMIAAKEAEISLKLVGSIRNKLLEAFHELWRTSV